VFAVATWLYLTSLDGDITETLASQRELVSPQPRVYSVQCSEDYQNHKRYPGEVRMCAVGVTWLFRDALLVLDLGLSGVREKKNLKDKY